MIEERIICLIKLKEVQSDVLVKLKDANLEDERSQRAKLQDKIAALSY